MLVLFNILEQAWFQSILSAVALGIAGLITVYFTKLTKYISSKIKDKDLANALVALSNAVQAAVLSVQQTYVDELKKTGSFTDAAKSEALARALAAVKDSLTDEVKTQLEALHPKFDEWLTEQIEAAIQTLLK